MAVKLDYIQMHWKICLCRHKAQITWRYLDILCKAFLINCKMLKRDKPVIQVKTAKILEPFGGNLV